MSLFRKPSELQAKPGIVAMIYGSPGSGKSTLACSAPGAVLIDTDGGVMRMNGAHQIPTLQVERWEQIVQAVEALKNEPSVQTVVIDTVGKMMMYMEEHIKRTATGKRLELNWDGTLSLKGFGKRKQMFLDFIGTVTKLGKNIIFVAHDKEEKRGDDVKIRPEVGGSSTNDLMKELDLVGYMEMEKDNRTISFTPTDKFYAKNTCNMPGVITVPVLIDKKGNILRENNFMGEVIANYRNRIAESLENNRKLDALRKEIQEKVAAVKDAESADEFVKWINGVTHIYNSKAIAQALFVAKVKELGLKLNKETGSYETAV